MSKVSTEKKNKKKERERMYLMYYLNEDGKRVYTLKVRDYYRAFVCLFLSSLGETWRCVVISRARVGPEEDFGFVFGLEFLYNSLSLTIFLLCECRRRMMRFAENRAGWETNPERAPGSIQPGR